MKSAAAPRRYRQTARAAAAEANGERILDAFAQRLRDQWFDEIRLEEIAREAGVTVQTVIRRFGSKEGLLDATHERLGREIRGRRELPPGAVRAAVGAIVEDYEQVGDLVLRSLAQEDRHAAIRAMTDLGRAMHREWIGTVFSLWLDRLSKDDRRRTTDALVVAGDIYVWKLLRRDMRRPVAEYRELLERLLAAALGVPVEKMYDPPADGASDEPC